MGEPRQSEVLLGEIQHARRPPRAGPAQRRAAFVTISAASATVARLARPDHGVGARRTVPPHDGRHEPDGEDELPGEGLKNQPPGSGQFGGLSPKARETT